MIGAATRAAAAGLAVAACLALSACGDRSEAVSGSCAGAEVTVRGTSGDDRLRGTPGRDVIWGGGGDDRIEGLGGDDVLCGGPGADRLSGGAGNDVLDGGGDRRDVVDTESYDWVGDTLAGGPGDDTLVAGGEKGHEAVDVVSYASATGPVSVDLETGDATGEGHDRIRGAAATLVGSPHGDRLLGSSRDEKLLGGRGPDHLDGRGGDDRLDAAGWPRVDSRGHEGRDSSANLLLGGDGDDELQGAQGDDRLDGGAGNDALYGDLGADRVSGGDGDDSAADYLLHTTARGADRQVLDGGAGDDRLLAALLVRPGATGDDFSFPGGAGTVDLAAGVLRGRAGSVRFAVPVRGFDSLELPPGTWTAYGTDGPNEIIATDDKHPVTIHARGGDDRLAGTFADDLLDGGQGHDDASGYVGNDRYVDVEKIRR